MPECLYEIRHTYHDPPHGGVCLENEAVMVVVYLRLRIVSITVTSTGLDVLAVAGGSGCSDLPPVGISPAKIEVDSEHISASAITNRFMGVAPLRLKNANTFT